MRKCTAVNPRRTRSRARWLPLIVVVALMVGACSSTQSSPTAPATPAPATPAPATPAPVSSPNASTPGSSSAAASSGSAVQLPKPEVTNVRFGVLIVTNNPAFEIAIKDGLFAKYGLNVTYTPFTTDTSQVSALLSGQIDFISNIGMSQAIGSLKTNSPLVALFLGQDNISDNLYTSANVKTAADLKGKAIAISTFGSGVYGEALIFLKYLGLSPSDVTITQVGNDAARRAALAAGSVAGSIDDQSLTAQMTAAGFHVLAQGAKQTVGFPTSASVTSQAYVQKNPNTILAIVAALSEGIHIFLTNPTEAAQAASTFESIDLPTATANYQANINGWTPKDGRMTLAGMQAVQVVFAKTDPSLATVDVSKAFTNQFLDQLQSLGWYQAMGITP